MEQVQCNSLKYSLNSNDNTASLIGCDESTFSRDIFIPRLIDYKSREYIIISIGQEAFYCQNNIKSVTFQNNSEIQSIGDCAFSDSSLGRIEFPMNSKLKIINYHSFESCKIKAIHFPPSLEVIDCCAFVVCDNLKVVEFYFKF